MAKLTTKRLCSAKRRLKPALVTCQAQVLTCAVSGRRGFGYIYFLFFVLILASLIFGLSTVLIKQKQEQRADLAGVQAYYAALSAAEMLKKNPVLENYNHSIPSLQDLKELTGHEFKLTNGGGKLVKIKGVIYCIGYKGDSLDKAGAVRVLAQANGKLGIAQIN